MLPDIRAIPVGQARILRPHQRVDEAVFEGDDAPDSLHVGVFEEGDLVAVATVIREAPEGEPDERAWRIRGMATVPEVRGHGYGAALLERCIEHALEHAGTLAWCTARATTVEFYRRFGFEVQGDGFLLPVTGLHFRMLRHLTP